MKEADPHGPLGIADAFDLLESGDRG